MAQQLFELIKKDHRQVEQLMDKLVDVDEDQRQEIFEQLNESLSQHLQIEEKYFYPRIRKADQLKDLVIDALEEHREAKEYLQRLNRISIETEQWIDTLQEMQEGVLHHIEDEEDKIFPKCAQVLDDAQMQEIAQQYIDEKEKGPTRAAPRRAPAKQPGRQPRQTR